MRRRNSYRRKKEENLLLAESLVDPLENAALTYTKTTVRQTVVEKVYALAKEAEVSILEERKDEGARVISEHCRKMDFALSWRMIWRAGFMWNPAM